MGLRITAALLLGLFFASCSPEHFPLVVIHGRTYLEGRDALGRAVRFSVDTGSDRSFLSRSWVEEVGGQVTPGSPGSWGGIRLFAQWRERAKRVPVPEGVPAVLEGLPAARGSPSSPLAGAVPTVGLLGTDVLWDWSIDFRGEVPYLVHGSVSTTGRTVGQVLVQDDGRFAVSVEDGVESSLPGRAVVDTGSPFPVVLFQGDPPQGVYSVQNARSPLTANGTLTRFFSIGDFHVGRFRFPTLALSGEFAGARILLLGTPALQALGAIVDLRDWNLILSPRVKEVELTVDSPEAWAWSATVLPGRGIRVDGVVEGSSLARRGLKAGDVVAKIGAEPADQPRSVLEWKRAWRAFALEAPATP